MIQINLNLEQQIKRVLGCPLGARVLNPGYGSLLHEFTDQQATNLAAISIELARAVEQNLNLNIEEAKVNQLKDGFRLQMQLENKSNLSVEL